MNKNFEYDRNTSMLLEKGYSRQKLQALNRLIDGVKLKSIKSLPNPTVHQEVEPYTYCNAEGD